MKYLIGNRVWSKRRLYPHSNQQALLVIQENGQERDIVSVQLPEEIVDQILESVVGYNQASGELRGFHGKPND